VKVCQNIIKTSAEAEHILRSFVSLMKINTTKQMEKIRE